MSDQAEMKVRAIVPWFGGKRTLAPSIVQELGTHTQYFEPFCGSMAVLFAKEPVQKETVNDKHGALVNLARVLQVQERAERLYERLWRVILCEDILKDAGLYLEAETPESELDPEDWAYWFFLASWMQRNGVAGTDRVGYQIAVRWTKNGGSPSVRFRNVVESIPAFHRRLLNVVILHRDAFLILDRFEDVRETAIYADPPYMPDTRSGFTTNAGEHSRYLHEFEHGAGVGLFPISKPDDHQRLHGVLSSYKRARIVVSYYDCPQVRSLYRGWTFIAKPMGKALGYAAGSGARHTIAPEVIIINGPSLATGASL